MSPESHFCALINAGELRTVELSCFNEYSGKTLISVNPVRDYFRLVIKKPAEVST